MVEKVSGARFADFMKSEIFAPAGMDNTRIYHRRKNGVTIDNYAYGLVLEDGKYVLPDVSKNNAYVIPLDGIEGDGVVNTTVGDLLKWDRALREGRVLTGEAQALMYTEGKLNDGKGDGYGFGYFISHDDKLGLVAEHSGGWPGYSTNFVRYIDADMALVVFMNRTGGDSTARRLFSDGMTAIVKGSMPGKIATLDELIIKDADAASYRALCGRYEGGHTFLMKEGRPYLRILVRGEELMEFELFPIGKDIFGVREAGFELDFSSGRLAYDRKEYKLTERGDFSKEA